VEPSKGDGYLFRARPRPRRDIGLLKRVSSVAIVPMRPSPPSPTLWERGATGRCHARCCAPYAPRQLHPRVSARATTEQKTPTPPPSKPLLDKHRARHDTPPEARFARTAVYSTTLYAIPSHVGITVRHACKLPRPWPIKGGSIPWPHGDDGQHSLTRFPPSPRYWHLASIKTSGTWRLLLLSRLACSTPLQAPRCNAIQCLGHTPVGRTAPAEIMINAVSPSCLAPSIER
jgi:hypothetical protein